MTIFTEKVGMQLAFNKILKTDFSLVLPYLEKLQSQALPPEILKERLLEMFEQNYECFGIYRAGKLVGVFGLWFMTRHYAGRTCEVDHIYIDDDLQGLGVGTQLFQFIDQYAKKKQCETIELNSYVENFRSHKFYMNLGFVIRGYHFLKKL
ncbi:GNAT family N-acetyltransferase [Christiangramia sp. OXR-203]|jgi:GNAT superfamily N-acetyltransferase|uniref:GNAT family N-acetyltransferase n=1 Tax=Christiangramia sp. OXR-203 TaxID=3100176 RepID=UPI002AC89D73|nr:GNAT family N-acetyltransferase [Christiangramia sp. OXR-203]WPY98003.1 GNAT family N-acetyltransferase [Christiangramia sp. OXR-203]